MTQIIGFAGKKQSGKNTACNFVLAVKLAQVGICKTSRLTDDGHIEVTDILGDKPSNMDWIPFKEPHVDVTSLFENELKEYIQLYALANSLKEMAVNILGLKPEQVFGTDKQKNTLTSISWEDMPGEEAKKHAPGKMTSREVLQYVGTDFFRKFYPNVWLDSCLRKIEEESPEIALISDVRFENEIRGIQKKNGFVVGLKRDPYKKGDKHASEIEIEKCFGLCNAVIDNAKLTIPEQNEHIYNALTGVSEISHDAIFPFVKEEEVVNE